MDHSRQKQDLSGQKFGKLTVLGPAENVGAYTVWRCLGGYHRFEDAVKARKRAEEELHDSFLAEFSGRGA